MAYRSLLVSHCQEVVSLVCSFFLLFFTFYLNYSNISKYFTEFPKTWLSVTNPLTTNLSVARCRFNHKCLLFFGESYFGTNKRFVRVAKHSAKFAQSQTKEWSSKKTLSCVGFVKTVTEM
jgi:hypothetical protein